MIPWLLGGVFALFISIYAAALLLRRKQKR